MKEQKTNFTDSFTSEELPKVYRTVKDRLFRYIFTRPDHKDWALNLYNSLEGTDYTDPDDLELVTLENAVYMNMRNDVSVLVSSWNLSFYEHQSTPNPNIPYRMFGYCRATMEKYVAAHEINVFGSKRMILPMPRFHVIYNGTEKAGKKEELKLSDLYYNEGEKREPMLELKVIQHNINGYVDGKNKCRQLYEYQWFTETFRRLMEEGYTAEEAVEQTMNEIPEDFTIRQLLRLNRDEVIGMWLFEYDEKKHMEMERRDSEAQGFEKGKAEGKAQRTAELIQRKLDKGKTFEQACEDLELSEAEIEEIRQFFKV